MRLHTVTVRKGIENIVIHVEDGVRLRDALLDAGLSPYATLTQKLNCGGRGLCATCGVWVVDGEANPEHWHDKIARRFSYPRLSCQIVVRSNLIVELIPEKWIWGSRDPERNS